jgi:hypothetical protein
MGFLIALEDCARACTRIATMATECAGAPLAPTSAFREKRQIAHAVSSVENTNQVAVAPSMSGHDIRRAFLEFYAARGHTLLPSSSLVPEDPTVLLTIAGRSF